MNAAISRYIPKNASRVASKLCDAVAYLYSAPGTNRPCVIAYSGKSSKPLVHCGFASEQRRARYMADWFASMASRASDKAARRQARKDAPRVLKVGDVLVSSWGYEQTNIDYYQVTRLVGEKSVALRPIGREVLGTENLQGKCVPAPDAFIGEEFVCRPDARGYCRLTSYSGASPAPRVLGPGGEFLGYQPHHWTAYY